MFIATTSAQAIVDEMKALLGNDINIMDETGTIIASTNPKRIGSLHEGAQRLLKDDLDEFIVEADDNLKNTVPGINFAIRIDGKTIGVIGVTGATSEVLTLGNVIKRMTELMIENQHQREDKLMLEDTRGQFIENWLFSDPRDIIDLEMRGHLLGIDTQLPRYVIMFEIKTPEFFDKIDSLRELQNNLMLKRLKNHVEHDKQNLCFIINQRIVLMMREQPKMEIARIAKAIHKDILSLSGQETYVGISAQACSGGDLRICYEQAKFACHIAANGGNNIIFYGGAQPEFIAQSLPDNVRDNVLSSVFGNCTDIEEAEIFEILQCFFKHDGNIADAAAELYIHRNTFQYRLNKVVEKTGYNVKIPRDAFVLYLAVLQHEHGIKV